MKYVISPHGVNDWCHICGDRKDHLCDIWYQHNAEHDEPASKGKSSKYVRICTGCGKMIAITQVPIE